MMYTFWQAVTICLSGVGLGIVIGYFRVAELEFRIAILKNLIEEIKRERDYYEELRHGK